MQNKLLILILMLGISFAANWTIDGQGVYWNNSVAMISVYPATSNELIQHTQYANFSYNGTTPRTVNISFIFDQPITSGNVMLWKNVTKTRQIPTYARQSHLESFIVINYTNLGTPQANCDIGDINNTYFYNAWINDSIMNFTANMTFCFNSFSSVGNNYTLNYSTNDIIGYTTQTYYEMDWADISSLFSSWSYGNHRAYTINNVPFTNPTLYQAKLNYKTAISQPSGKFSIYVHDGSPAEVIAGTAATLIELDPWWNTTWAYKQTYDYNSTSPTSIDNFPMPVYLDTTNTTLWNVSTAANCTNVRFLNGTEDGVLPYEYVNGCNTTNATFYVSANVSALATNTTIYAYLGNVDNGVDTSYLVNGLKARPVWTALGAWNVFHFQETGTNIIDSAGTCNGTITGTVTSVAGQFGNARNFTGGANYITTCAHTYTSANNSQFLVGWAMHNGTTPARKTMVSNYQANYKGFATEVGNFPAGTNMYSYFIENGTAGINATTIELAANAWNMLSGTYDGTAGNVRGFVNATNYANGTSSAYVESTNALRIGCNPVATTVSWNGTIDEIYLFDGSFTNINDVIQAFYGGYGSVGTTTQTIMPTIVSSRISPTTAYVNSTLLGYCNATDQDNATIRYYWQWYVDGAANESGVSGYLANATEENVANITSGNLNAGQNWILQCIANDGISNSTALNSSAVNISASCVGATTTFICGQTITESCTLNGDMSSTGITCFTVGANNVVLDGAGYTIDGDDTAITFGVYEDGFGNVTIKNTIITDFDYCVVISSYGNVNVDNNTISSCGTNGIHLSTNPFSVRVTNNNVSSCGSSDLFIEVGASSIIANNTLSSAPTGLFLSGTPNTLVDNNTISGCSDKGMDIESDYTTISNNIMANNTNYNLYIYISNYNNVTNNTASNSSNGYRPVVSNGNIFQNNTALGCSFGYLLYYSRDNIIKDSFVNGSTLEGIHIERGASTNNTFQNVQINYSTIDIGIDGSNEAEMPNNTFLNMTYDPTKVTIINDGGQAFFQWYLDVYVNDTNGSSVAGANVTGYDVNGTLAFSAITGGELPNNAADSYLNMTDNILLYHLNEQTGGIVDSSGSGNSGTNYGATNITGLFNTAYEFDGIGNHITVANPDNFMFGSDDFTLSAWVKMAPDTPLGMVLAKYNLSGDDYYIYAGNNVSYFSISGNQINNPTNIGDNQWHYLVGKREGNTEYLYVDAGTPTTADTTGFTANAGGNLEIGKFGVIDGYYYFGGIIDEVAVFNRSLSVQEMTSIYHFQRLSHGFVPTQNVTEYMQNITGKYYYTNYSINATNATHYSDTMSLNLTTNIQINLTLTNLIITNTCTAPMTGDWTISCSDNCLLATPITMNGNVLMNGTGYVDLNTTMTFTGTGRYIAIFPGCQLNIYSSGRIN